MAGRRRLRALATRAAGTVRAARPSRPSVGQQYRPYACGEGVGVRQPRAPCRANSSVDVEPACRGRAPARRAAAGSAAPAAAPTAAYWSRSSSIRLGRPRQQLAVQQQPVSVQLATTDRPSRRPTRTRASSRLVQLRSSKNGRPVRVYTAPVLPSSTPKRPGGLGVAGRPPRRPASPCASPRTRTLPTPSSRYAANASAGCSRKPGSVRRRARRHRRRQVHQPARIHREPAHHLQRRGGVLLADRDPAQVPWSRRCARPSTSSRSSTPGSRRTAPEAERTSWPPADAPARTRPARPAPRPSSRSG